MWKFRKCLHFASSLGNSLKMSSRPHAIHKQQITKRKSNLNAGIRNRISLLELDENNIANSIGIEELENSLLNEDEMLDPFEKEQRQSKRLAGQHQVKRLYFKEEKLPNMLTWAEKEEIRALHSEDPDMWTETKLALSFPATPSIIKKILKSYWKMESLRSMERHDQKVYENWAALFDGKLDVPNEALKSHLLTFVKRRKPVGRGSPEFIEENLPFLKKPGGVFSKIVSGYQNPNKKTTDPSATFTESDENSAERGLSLLRTPPQNDTFIIPKCVQEVKLRTQKLMTLESMRRRLTQEEQTGKELKKDELAFIVKKDVKRFYEVIKDPIGPPTELIKTDSQVQKVVDESESNSVSPSNMGYETIALSVPQVDNYELPGTLKEKTHCVENPDESISMGQIGSKKKDVDSHVIAEAIKSYTSQPDERYPLKINIPKEMWRKGALFKVKDRFYTDDGEFLFRVPGLI